MIKNLFLIVTVAAFSALASAHEAKKAGPNGGRIFASVTPHVEFFVTTERKIQFTFLDEHGKAIAPSGQSVTVTTGDRSAPTVLKFNRQADVLLSDLAVPEGRNVPAVVQITPAPGATVVVERLNINLAVCSECKHAEYACTCGH